MRPRAPMPSRSSIAAAQSLTISSIATSVARARHGRSPCLDCSLLEPRGREPEAEQPPVPPLAPRFLLGARVGVIVIERAHEERGLIRERVLGEERHHVGLVVEEALEEAREPADPPGVVECGEPELPVEPRL